MNGDPALTQFGLLRHAVASAERSGRVPQTLQHTPAPYAWLATVSPQSQLFDPLRPIWSTVGIADAPPPSQEF